MGEYVPVQLHSIFVLLGERLPLLLRTRDSLLLNALRSFVRVLSVDEKRLQFEKAGEICTFVLILIVSIFAISCEIHFGLAHSHAMCR